MKFIIIHNLYSRAGGEDEVVQLQVNILRSAGHEVVLYQRAYAEITQQRFGRLRSGFTALRNRQVVNELNDIVRTEKPDVAIVHNLFPIISAAVLPMLKAQGVRVMMTLHNFRLACPNGLFYTHGQICERCAHSSIRELNCILNCCAGGFAQSVAFAMRGWWSRIRGYYSKNIDLFLALSDFQKDKIIAVGFDKSKFVVMPNATGGPEMAGYAAATTAGQSDYVAYVGRLSLEKGIGLLLDTARSMPDIQFKVAGSPAQGFTLPTLPPNIQLMGFLGKQQLADFYIGSRCVILTSRCWESFGLSVVQAMYYGRTVIVPRMAALPEIIDHQRCGLLFDTPKQLQDNIRRLFNDTDLRSNLETEAAKRAHTIYSPQAYLHNLMSAVDQLF